jgi:hypothetical protein
MIGWINLKAMETLSTKDYLIFKILPSNRAIDELKVRRLMREIKKNNLLHLYPGICNKDHALFDGQHRLEAAKRLNEYYHYTIDPNITEVMIAGMNSASTNWNVNDYINFWLVKNQSGFDVLSDFMIGNPLLPASTVLKMIGVGNSTFLLRKGKVDVSLLGDAKNVVKILDEYNAIIDFAYDRNLILAIIQCLKTEGYDHEVMLKKLEYNSRGLRKCVSVRQYCTNIEEIYNYNSSKNKLRIDF